MSGVMPHASYNIHLAGLRNTWRPAGSSATQQTVFGVYISNAGVAE